MPLLTLPENGITVRMYRQGHGDCFLLAFPREGGGNPYYVMIDCGYKPGSQAYLDHGKGIGDVVQHLRESCGGHLDLVILTHEHQDHLNGLWKASNPYFEDFEIEEAWVAWTEDRDNPTANALRKRHRDQLLGLLEARNQLALAAGEDSRAVKRLNSLLDLELGGTNDVFNLAEMSAAASEPEKSVNKQGLRLIREKANSKRGCRYCYPGKAPLPLVGSAGVRAFIFGPPENADLIADEDPQPGEAFQRDHAFSFVAAALSQPLQRIAPFSRHYFVPCESAFGEGEFFLKQYGEGPVSEDEIDGIEVPTNAAWRRIDNEWLYSSESLALKLNAGINNTSLVVAFELPQSGKVLFFAADAQRGNWISWKELRFHDGDKVVTAKDLLSRAVLYKVGHHGSHNATLFGTASDEYPNLGWMGQGAAATEFTAMITAVNRWALEKNKPPWIHPLPSIKEALIQKARGRVFQTDVNTPEKPNFVSNGEWKRFTDKSTFDTLYFDWQVTDT